MGLFWNRQDRGSGPVEQLRSDLAALEAEVAKLASELRTVQLESATIADKVYRWMKRAQRAEHRAEIAAGPVIPAVPVETPLSLSGSRRVRGVRARIAARRQLEAREAMQSPANGNGAELAPQEGE